MKHFSVIAFLLAATCAFAGDAKTNFSGEWHIDVTQSDTPEWGYAKVIMVELNDSLLTTTRQVTSNFGDYTDVEKFYLDGRESKNDNDQVKRKSVIAWSEDGKSLTFKTDLNIINMGMDAKVVSVCKLSDDGKQLHINTTSESTMGNMDFKSLYNKK